jgi:hypothetical protein
MKTKQFQTQEEMVTEEGAVEYINLATEEEATVEASEEVSEVAVATVEEATVEASEVAVAAEHMMKSRKVEKEEDHLIQIDLEEEVEISITE